VLRYGYGDAHHQVPAGTDPVAGHVAILAEDRTLPVDDRGERYSRRPSRRARCAGRAARGRGGAAARHEDTCRQGGYQAGPQDRDHTASMAGTVPRPEAQGCRRVAGSG
jgi:hypothetical protein